MKVNNPTSSSDHSSNDSVESYAEIRFEKSVCDDDEIKQELAEIKRQHALDIAALKEDMVSRKEVTLLLRALLCLESKESLQGKSGQEILDIFKCLSEGSERFHIAELSAKAQLLAVNAMKAKPSHSVACLKALENYPGLLGESDTKSLALAAIRKDPKLLLNDEPLTLLSPEIIGSILKDEKLQTDEYTLFTILESWSKIEEGNPSEALDLMNHIKLEFMSRSELLEMEDSPLVSKDRLLNAYKDQVLVAEKNLGFSGKKVRHHSRKICHWKGLNSDTVVGKNKGNWETSVLDCEPMQAGGIYKWSIKCDEGSCNNSSYLGVVADRKDLNYNSNLGAQSGGWSIRNDGYKFHNGSNGSYDSSLTFKAGSKVTFVLDLTGGGTLSASIDGSNPMITLFSWMLSKSSSLGASGFLPAASVYSSSVKFKFLGFE